MCHAVAGAHGVTQHPGEVFDDFISRSMAETALQFVEVLARRADLIVNQTAAEISLAQARASLLLNSATDEVFHE